MKKTTSIVLCILMVFSCFSCLLVPSVSAEEPAAENLVGNGDFQDYTLNENYFYSVGMVGVPSEADRGNWSRATMGNWEPTYPDYAKVEGKDYYASVPYSDYQTIPEVFARCTRVVRDPLDPTGTNKVLRIGQTARAFLNENYDLRGRTMTLSFKIMPVGQQWSFVYFAFPNASGAAHIVPAFALTQDNILSAYLNGAAYAGCSISDNRFFLKNLTANAWNNISLKVQLPDSYAAAVTEAYDTNYPIFAVHANENLGDAKGEDGTVLYNGFTCMSYLDDVVVKEYAEPVPGDGTFESYDTNTSFKMSRENATVGALPEVGEWGHLKNDGYFGKIWARETTLADGTTKTDADSGSFDYREAATVVVTNAKAHTGNNSLKVYPDWGAFATGLKVQKNTDYKLSFYWLTDNADINFLFSGISSDLQIPAMNNITSVSQNPQMVAVYNPNVPGSTTEWTKYELSFNSGNLEKVYFAISAKGDKTFYIDDFKLEATSVFSSQVVGADGAVRTNEVLNVYASDAAGAKVAGGAFGKEIATAVADGETVYYTADVKDYFTFDGWYKNGVKVSADQTLAVTGDGTAANYVAKVVSKNVATALGSFENTTATFTKNWQYQYYLDARSTKPAGTDEYAAYQAKMNDPTVNYQVADITGQMVEDAVYPENPVADKLTAAQAGGRKGVSETNWVSTGIFNDVRVREANSNYTLNVNGSNTTQTIPAAPSGNKALQATYYGFSPISVAQINVAKNQKYKVRFSMWTSVYQDENGNWKSGGSALQNVGVTEKTSLNALASAEGFTGKQALANLYIPGVEKENVSYERSGELMNTQNSWVDYEFSFTSGDQTTLYLYFQGASENHQDILCLDDVYVYPEGEAQDESSFTFGGASIRTNELPALRFKYTLDKTAIDGEIVECGFAAIRTSYLGGAALVKDGEYGGKKAASGIAYHKNNATEDNRILSEDENTVTFRAALYNIGVSSRDQSRVDYSMLGDQYSVRPYAIVEKDGAQTTVYGPTESYAIFEVAKFLEDNKDSGDAGIAADWAAVNNYFNAEGQVTDINGVATRAAAYTSWKANGNSYIGDLDHQ